MTDNSSVIHIQGLTKLYGRQRGIIDINLDIQFHGKEKSLISGGVEGNFVYQTSPISDTIAKVIPYIQLSTPGVVYKAQINTKVWPFDLADMSDMFAVFLSIEAAF